MSNTMYAIDNLYIYKTHLRLFLNNALKYVYFIRHHCTCMVDGNATQPFFSVNTSYVWKGGTDTQRIGQL